MAAKNHSGKNLWGCKFWWLRPRRCVKFFEALFLKEYLYFSQSSIFNNYQMIKIRWKTLFFDGTSSWLLWLLLGNRDLENHIYWHTAVLYKHTATQAAWTCMTIDVRFGFALFAGVSFFFFIQIFFKNLYLYQYLYSTVFLSASSMLPPPLSESWKYYFCSHFPRSQSLAFIFTFIHWANIVTIASIIFHWIVKNKYLLRYSVSIVDCLRKTLAREIQSPACLTWGHVVTLSSSVSQQSSMATAEAAG